MTFYDKNESREIQTLPPSIPWGGRVKRNIPDAPITDEQYRQAGFVPVHPDPEHRPIPDGMEIARGGRGITPRDDGDMQEFLTLITTAEGQAIRDAEAAARPPEPSSVVIDIDSATGQASGKTYRVICVDGTLVSTLNSASPQRHGKAQIGEAVNKRKAQKLAIADFRKGGWQPRIEALEAWVLAQEVGESGI